MSSTADDKPKYMTEAEAAEAKKKKRKHRRKGKKQIKTTAQGESDIWKDIDGAPKSPNISQSREAFKGHWGQKADTSGETNKKALMTSDGFLQWGDGSMVKESTARTDFRGYYGVGFEASGNKNKEMHRTSQGFLHWDGDEEKRYQSTSRQDFSGEKAYNVKMRTGNANRKMMATSDDFLKWGENEHRYSSEQRSNFVPHDKMSPRKPITQQHEQSSVVNWGHEEVVTSSMRDDLAQAIKRREEEDDSDEYSHTDGPSDDEDEAPKDE